MQRPVPAPRKILDGALHRVRRDADVVGFMVERGLVVYDVLEGEARLLDGALAQIDLVFVPADAAIRRDPRFLSTSQADAYAARWRRGVRAPSPATR